MLPLTATIERDCGETLDLRVCFAISAMFIFDRVEHNAWNKTLRKRPVRQRYSIEAMFFRDLVVMVNRYDDKRAWIRVFQMLKS